MSPMNNRLLVPRKTPGLLDLVPGAAAAYSLRSLSNSYADPVVTVRRSSDNAEEDFTAAEVADGTLAAFCGAGDGFVKQWWDQSGNARHAVAAADANEPKIVDSGVVVSEGGRPAIDFDGSDDLLQASVTSFARIGTISAVVRSDKSTGIQTIVRLGDITGSVFRYDNGQLRFFVPGVINAQTPVDAQSQAAISGLNSGTSVEIFYNAASVQTAAGTESPLVFTVLRIGNQGSTEDFDGVISEVIIYEDALPTLLPLINGNQMWYY